MQPAHYPSNLKIIVGDLLESDEPVIVHQANCVTRNSLGFAKSLFTKYPHADIYKDRKEPDVAGTISVVEAENYPTVVHLFGQFSPGKGRKSEKREQWFQQGLLCIENFCKENKIQRLAMPYRIGCGLAGGNWTDYENMIILFCRRNPKLQVNLYLKMIT